MGLKNVSKASGSHLGPVQSHVMTAVYTPCRDWRVGAFSFEAEVYMGQRYKHIQLTSMFLSLDTLRLWGWVIFCGKGHSGCCRIPSNVSGLYPPDASSRSSSSWDNPRCLQTSPDASLLTFLAMVTLPSPPPGWLNKSLSLSWYDLKHRRKLNVFFLKKCLLPLKCHRDSSKLKDCLSDELGRSSL